MSNSVGDQTPNSNASSAPASPEPKSATDVAQESVAQESAEELAYANRPFRGWRLLGVIGIVVVVLAVVSAIVDWVVIGPLEGRVF